MQCEIDYLSISLPYHSVILRQKDGSYKQNPNLYSPRDVMMSEYLLNEKQWLAGAHFAPFSQGIYSPTLGCTYMMNPKLAFSLIQFTGAGCEMLREHLLLQDMLFHFHDRVTLIDIACDIETETHPQSFIESRLNKRFKNRVSHGSDTGVTEYLGAQNSDRMVKVYRYKFPHPRHALLRVEYRQKGELAKATAAAIVQDGVLPVAAALGKVYGWSHADWNPLARPTTAELTATKERGLGHTETWLFKQVLPALRRLRTNGAIDILKAFRNELDQIIGA